MMTHFIADFTMNPQELAAVHPRLYHVTEPGAWSSIKKYGLLSTSSILNQFGIEGEQRAKIETQRRPHSISLKHSIYGTITLNDNVPLSENALLSCLDDDLKPAQWLRMLNARVFFWPDQKNLHLHLNARLNRHRIREVIVVDTLRIAEKYAEQMELCAINSGSTIRKPARRGLKTFTPLLAHSYGVWRKLRGGQDHIREIIVLDAIIDIVDFTVDVYQTQLNN